MKISIFSFFFFSFFLFVLLVYVCECWGIQGKIGGRKLMFFSISDDSLLKKGVEYKVRPNILKWIWEYLTCVTKVTFVLIRNNYPLLYFETLVPDRIYFNPWKIELKKVLFHLYSKDNSVIQSGRPLCWDMFYTSIY